MLGIVICRTVHVYSIKVDYKRSIKSYIITNDVI